MSSIASVLNANTTEPKQKKRHFVLKAYSNQITQIIKLQAGFVEEKEENHTFVQRTHICRHEAEAQSFVSFDFPTC